VLGFVKMRNCYRQRFRCGISLDLRHSQTTVFSLCLVRNREQNQNRKKHRSFAKDQWIHHEVFHLGVEAQVASVNTMIECASL
jgi:hypothetical protein